MFIIYCGLIPIILVLGFVTTMTVELPFGHLLKIAITDIKQSAKEKKGSAKNESLLTSESINDAIVKKEEAK